MTNVKVMVDNYKCTGCTRCALFCPYGCISFTSGDLGFPVPHIEECNNCGVCIKSCPWSDEFDKGNDE